MPCPDCVGYGMNGLVPAFITHTEEERALLPLWEQHKRVQVIWVPCAHCIGGIASCCDTAGANGE